MSWLAIRALKMKGRAVTQCERLRLLAGASGSTGQTGASGQTGLTGGFWTLVCHQDVCRHGKSSELCTEKGRHVTQCEAL